MTRILILSSLVAHGHVGLSAAMPVLQRLGHEVTGLPTVLLSNHPGWPHVAGQAVPVAQLDGMLDALCANGWLGEVETVLTGYLPTPGHVDFACRLIDRVGPQARLVVDPVLGDAPKGLYIAEDTARRLRAVLVPRADILTPNAFELGWLTGHGCGDLRAARDAARALPMRVLLTSPPLGAEATGVLDNGPPPRLYRTAQVAGVPHGVGDVFSGLIAAGLTVGAALGHLQALIAASLHQPHLAIVTAAEHWTAAPALPPEELPHGL